MTYLALSTLFHVESFVHLSLAFAYVYGMIYRRLGFKHGVTDDKLLESIKLLEILYGLQLIIMVSNELSIGFVILKRVLMIDFLTVSYYKL